MSDLFHQHVPASYVDKVLDTIRATPWHSYQVLTKRPGKMASVMRRLQPEPLPNLWLGTSVEDDDHVGRADSRADLRRIPGRAGGADRIRPSAFLPTCLCRPSRLDRAPARHLARLG